MEYSFRNIAPLEISQGLADKIGLTLSDPTRRGEVKRIPLDPSYVSVHGFVTNYNGIANQLRYELKFSEAVRDEFQRTDREHVADANAIREETIKYVRLYVILASLGYARERIAEDGVFPSRFRQRLVKGIDEIVEHIHATDVRPEFVEREVSRYLRAIETDYTKRRAMQEVMRTVYRGNVLGRMAKARQAPKVPA